MPEVNPAALLLEDHSQLGMGLERRALGTPLMQMGDSFFYKRTASRTSLPLPTSAEGCTFSNDHPGEPIREIYLEWNILVRSDYSMCAVTTPAG